jgi:hypothetical protein
MAGQDLKKNFAAQFPRKISCCKNYFEFSLKNAISVQIDIFTACHCKISNCVVQNLWRNKASWRVNVKQTIRFPLNVNNFLLSAPWPHPQTLD